MKVRILSPAYGDQVMELEPAEAARVMLDECEAGRAGFIRFSDGDIYDMMRRTGILEQVLKSKDAAGVDATVIPRIAGG